MASRARLHAELIAFLRQHCPARDQRHLVLQRWMVAGLLLSLTVCSDHWKTRLTLGHYLASSWQRSCQRWLANARIDAESLYGPLILWAIQGWHKPRSGHASGYRHHHALQPHLRGDGLNRLPQPCHSATCGSGRIDLTQPKYCWPIPPAWQWRSPGT